MTTRHRFLIGTALILPLLGAGCISVSNQQKTNTSGGVFKSGDKGATWAQKVALPTPKGVQSIAGVDVVTFAFDPEDPKAVYLGTAANGLLYSYDGGESWQRAGGLTAGRIDTVAVHPKDKCTVFATIGNRLVRTTDCNRTFDVVYTDPRGQAQITALVIDWFNPNVLYLGTATGELIRSQDGGATWAPVQRWSDGIVAVVMSKGDSRRIWVGRKGYGLATTADGGATWTDIKKEFETFSGALALVALEEDRSAPGTLVTASRFGLLRSTDNGASWQKLNILTPPQAVTITTLALNPKNGKDIYYTTGTKLYRSSDGGATWATSDLPTSRTATALSVDPAAETVIYLGVTEPKK